MKKPQQLLSCTIGTEGERFDESFHLSKDSLAFLQARCHDALHRCQLQFGGRRRVTGTCRGVAESGILVTERPKIRTIHPQFQISDLCQVFRMTIVMSYSVGQL